MLRLLGSQKEDIAAIVIAAVDYRIYDGKGQLRVETTDREYAVRLVEANRHMGAYCRELECLPSS